MTECESNHVGKGKGPGPKLPPKVKKQISEKAINGKALA
ncbi:hypothetical protein PC116_g29217, partial [Phytophthora cactorum]